MIIKYFTDNDVYKFSVMYAIQRLYPWSYVNYEFINRGGNKFPKGFAERMREEVDHMANLKMTKAERLFIEKECCYFDPSFIDLLESYRYNPNEVTITQSVEGELEVTIEGYWYRTVLWEVPLMAIISELYFQMTGVKERLVEQKAISKAEELVKLGVQFSEFGTRRRFSFDVQSRVINCLQQHGLHYFQGTSNVYMAMKYNVKAIGTMPHEWTMYHGALFGYRYANTKALETWLEVFGGRLGISLTDTYTTDLFFENFSLKQAKVLEGLRCDSGDPLEFIEKAMAFYHSVKVDPSLKTIVFSDALNLETIKRISKSVKGRFKDTYGVGTFFTNDVGATPLNMVLKLTQVRSSRNATPYNVVKLSDDMGKSTGDKREIQLCKQVLGV